MLVCTKSFILEYLYVSFGKKKLFSSCFQLVPVISVFLSRFRYFAFPYTFSTGENSVCDVCVVDFEGDCGGGGEVLLVVKYYQKLQSFVMCIVVEVVITPFVKYLVGKRVVGNMVVGLHIVKMIFVTLLIVQIMVENVVINRMGG